MARVDDGEQLEMFDRERIESEDDGEVGAPTLSDHDLARLADLVARRVIAALPSPGSPKRTQSRTSGADLDHPDPTESDEALLTADQVAELLGVTPAWIYGQSRRGLIPTVKLGRYYRYRLAAIQTWIAEREAA